ATIGAAVAVTLANATNQASLPAGDTVKAKSLTVSAGVTNNAGDQVSTDAATATSGAGASDAKLSVAGSFALVIATQTTLAQVAGTVNLTAGALTVTATSALASTAKADPADGTGVSAGTVGVGASVALDLVTDTTT
ncbi:hypothetical protein AB4Z22_45095, partial [Paenibacillus sp. TAF58]